MAGRVGFEPTVELNTRQPLSRRPQSSTLAPPRGASEAEGEGFEPPVGLHPQLFSRQPPSSTRPSLPFDGSPSWEILP